MRVAFAFLCSVVLVAPAVAISGVWLEVEGVGRAPNDVELVDGLAVFATVTGVTVREVDDPDDLPVAAEIRLPEEAHRIKVVGDLAAVAFGYDGVALIDLSDPRAPRLITTLYVERPIADIDVTGDLLVAVGGTEAVIVGIADPSHPQVLARAGMFGWTSWTERFLAVVLDGRRLFVRSGREIFGSNVAGHLFVWDISDPTSPVELSCVSEVFGLQLEVVGGVLAALTPGVQTFDVSDPAAPAELGDLPGSHFFTTREGCVRGTLLFLGERRELQVVDIGHPTAPFVVGTLDLGFEIRAVDVDGGKVCAVGTPGSGRVALVDVTTPSAPALLAEHAFPGRIRRIDLHEGVLAVAAEHGGLGLVTVADPAAPELVSLTEGVVSDARFVADRLYVGRWDATGSRGVLDILDVADPAAPTPTGGIEDFPGYWRLAEFGETLLAMDPGRELLESFVTAHGWLRAFGLDDPDQPEEVDPVRLDAGMPKVEVSAPVFAEEVDGFAFVMGVHTKSMWWKSESAKPYDQGGDVVDSRPYPGGRLYKVWWEGPSYARDVPASELYTGGTPTGLIHHDGFLYTTTREDGLVVWDAEHAEHLVRLGSVMPAGRPSSLTAAGDTLLVGHDGPGLAVVDARDPRAPRVVTDVPLRRAPLQLVVDAQSRTAWSAAGLGVEGVDLDLATCAGVTASIDPDGLLTGGEPARVTVEVRNVFGEPVAGRVVDGSSTLGLLGSFRDAGDGGYTASLWPGPKSGDGTVQVSLDGVSCPLSETFTVACSAGAPTVPPNVRADGIDESSVRVGWGHTQHASGFWVYRDDEPVAELGALSTSWIDDGLADGGHRCYRVSAFDACGGETDRSRAACAVPTAFDAQCLSLADERLVFPDTDWWYVSLAARDGLLFEVRQGSLAVWELRGPGRPRRISRWTDGIEAGGTVRPEVTVGPGVVVVAETSTIRTYDVTSPLAPYPAGAVSIEADGEPCTVWGLASSESTVAASTSCGLCLLDVSDLLRPVVASVVEEPPLSSCAGLSMNDGVVWVVDSEGGLTAVDAANPYDPSIGGTVSSLDLFDARLRRADGTLVAAVDDQLHTFTLEDPMVPQYAASLDVTIGNPWRQWLAVDGETVYLASLYSNPQVARLTTVDVGDPSAPAVLGHVEWMGRVIDMVALEQTAYVVSEGLLGIDVDDPAAPTLLGRLTRPRDEVELLRTADGVGWFRTEYVDGWRGLETWDLDGPSAPRRLGKLELCADGGIDFGPDRAFVGCLGEDPGDGGPAVAVVGTADPVNPMVSTTVSPSVSPERLELFGPDALAVLGEEGVQTIDLLTGSSGWWPAVWDRRPETQVTVDGHLLLVGSVSPYLWSLDVRDAGAGPTLAAHEPLMSDPGAWISDARSVLVGDDLWLWLSQTGPATMCSVDVADPTDPELVGTFDDFSRRPALLPLGSYLLAVGGGDDDSTRIDLVNVDDPASPVLADRLELEEGPGAADVVDSGCGALIRAGGWLVTVDVECRTPEAEFRFVGSGRRVLFRDASRYGPEELLWDLGDGTLATDGELVHEYPRPGVYPVSLEARNAHGADSVRIEVPVGCDLDHDRSADGLDVSEMVVELFDGDGTAPATAWAGSHRGSAEYDLDLDGVISGRDLGRLLTIVSDGDGAR